MQHKKKWFVPDNPAVLVPQRKNITFLGTATRQVGELDKKAKEGEDAIEGRARLDWKKREYTGYESVHSNMQLYSAPKLESLIGVKISQYCSIDMNETGAMKNGKTLPSLAQQLGRLESWTRRQRRGKMQLRAGRV